MLAQGFLDLFFDAAPISNIFLQFFELSTKAAFDTHVHQSPGEGPTHSPELRCEGAFGSWFAFAPKAGGSSMSEASSNSNPENWHPLRHCSGQVADEPLLSDMPLWMPGKMTSGRTISPDKLQRARAIS